MKDGLDSLKILVWPKPVSQSTTWFDNKVVAHGGPEEWDIIVFEATPITFGDGKP